MTDLKTPLNCFPWWLPDSGAFTLQTHHLPPLVSYTPFKTHRPPINHPSVCHNYSYPWSSQPSVYCPGYFRFVSPQGKGIAFPLSSSSPGQTPPSRSGMQGLLRSLATVLLSSHLACHHCIHALPNLFYWKKLNGSSSFSCSTSTEF